MRFNYLDADIPGNDYQFPTSIEGVLGYNNAIVLTQPHAHRRPEVPARPDLLVRRLAVGRAGLQGRPVPRQPGRPGELVQQLHPVHRRGGLAGYQIHGGPAGDRRATSPSTPRATSKGQLDVLRHQQQRPHRVRLGRDDRQRRRRGVVPLARAATWTAPRPRTCTPARKAAAAGVPTRSATRRRPTEMRRLRRPDVKDAIVDVLWNPDRQAARAPRWPTTASTCPWKEINNYYPFAVGLMPKPGDADYADTTSRRCACSPTRRVPDLPVLHRQPGGQGRGRGRGRPGQQQLLHHQLDGAVPAMLARCCATTRPTAIDRGLVQEAAVLERLGAVPERRQHPAARRERVLGRLERPTRSASATAPGSTTTSSAHATGP